MGHDGLGVLFWIFSTCESIDKANLKVHYKTIAISSDSLELVRRPLDE